MSSSLRSPFLEILTQALSILQDLPGHLATWTAAYGPWIYLLLFAIIFAETGLVVTPFLPGDSLLFAIGALTSVAGGLDLFTCLALLWAAAVLGDNVNYGIGRWLGPKVFTNEKSKFFNPRHLAKTEAFFAKHGGRTLMLARFMPIVRTYAPFVAGVSRLSYARFLSVSVLGGALWISAFTLAGHFFGNIPQVKSNFHIVIAAILVISVLPAVIEAIRARRASPSV